MSNTGDERKDIDVKAALAAIQQQKREEAQQIKTPSTQTGQPKTSVYSSLAALQKIQQDSVSVKVSEAANQKTYQQNKINEVQQQFNEVTANKDKYDSSTYDDYAQNVGTYLRAANKNVETLDYAITSGTAAKILYGKNIKKLEAEALKPHLKKVTTYQSSPTKEQITELKTVKTQQKAIDILVSRGVAKRENGKVVLIKSPAGFTDELIEAAKKAGFKDIETEEGLSFKLFEYGQKQKEGLLRKETEYYSSVIGQSEKTIAQTIGALSSFLSGKPPKQYRKVDADTIGYVRKLSNAEKGYLATGAIGANFLTSYGVTYPIGIATSGFLRGVTAIAKSTGVSSPAAISKLATEISKHPRLVQAIMWAPVVGKDSVTVYNEYKAGVPVNKIVTDEAIRAGSIAGMALGLTAGFKTSDKVYEWYKTRGRNLIPPEELIRKVTLETGKLPTYKNKKTAWSDEFKALAKDLSAEEYLGAVAPDEYRVWHGTKSPFTLKTGETLEILPGTSLDKFPGLFVAPEPSPLRLPSGVGYSKQASRLGLPGVSSLSEIASIDALVEVMPSGLTRAQTQAWLNKQVGTTTAYIPPVSMITSEMEAIIPANSKLVKVGAEWYTNYAGHRVLVNKYVLIAEGTPISMLPVGSEIVNLSELSSTLPITETYLTYGITPPGLSSSLSSTQVTDLASTYGLTESEIRSLSESLSSSLTELSATPTISEQPLSLDELLPIIEPTRLDDSTRSETMITTSPYQPTDETPVITPTDEVDSLLTTLRPQSDERKRINLKLFNGPKEKYRVKFTYPRGGKEAITVDARSFPEAIDKAQMSRKPNKYPPSITDAVRTQ